LPSGNLPLHEQEGDFEKVLKEIFVLFGLNEIYSSTLTSGVNIERSGFSTEETPRVSNRLVTDYEYLRPSLFVGLLSACALNAENFEQSYLFEIGRIFNKKLNSNDLDGQPKKMAAVFVGNTFADMKGVLEGVLGKLGIEDIVFEKSKENIFSNAALVSKGEKSLGLMGEFSDLVLKNLGVGQRTFGFELDFESVKELIQLKKYQPLPKFPIIKENVSLFVPEKLNFSTIEKAIKASADGYVRTIELSEDINVKGRRSVLIAIEYFSPKRTLTSEEIRPIREKILQSLSLQGFEIRD
jgi:phenylalanyl-tRNA synthetase beta chain